MANTIGQDTALVRRAISRDADAFGALYECHLDAIYRYIYFRIGNARDAEDLTEQVFLKAWEALPNYKECGNPFVSWLYRIAHNIVADYYRRHPKVTKLPVESATPESNQPTTLDQVLEAEEMEMLAEAISKLPEARQQVIILRFIEGRHHAEVARMLDISEGACRVLQLRSLAALAQLMMAAEGNHHG